MLQEISVLREPSIVKTKVSERFKVRAILGSILLFVVGGVVGNRSDAVFLQSWSAVNGSMMGNWLPWVIAGGAIMVSISMSYLLLGRKASFERKLQEKNFLLDLAGTLSFLLPATLSMRDLSCGFHEFIARALETVFRGYLKDARRGCLFLPDARGESLAVSDIRGWVNDNGKGQRTFCIDPQKVDSAKGVAGEAFLKRKVVVAHVSVDNGHLKCDQASYVPSQDSILPFRGSLICVPVTSGESSSECLGVLCFDSYNTFAFDSPVVRDVLLLLAKYIFIALLMRKKIVEEVSVK